MAGDQIKTLRRESTYIRYQDVLKNHAYPTIGKIRRDQVSRNHIKKLLLDYHAEGHTKKAVTLLRDVVNGPFATAVDDELINVSPVTGVLGRLRIKEDNKESADPLNAEETALFLDICQEKHPDYYPLFLTMFRTGLRLGEVLALEGSDVDWHGRFFHVSRSYRRQKFSGTKTGKTRRVDMSDQVVEALQSLQEEGNLLNKREALVSGWNDMSGIIFSNAKGQPKGQNTVRYIFKNVLKEAGLRGIRLHDLRHSYASQLLSDGISPVYVKDQLGHHSIEITVDIYGHWIPSGNQEAVNRLDNMAEKHTQSAPSPHPPKNESGQDIENSSALLSLVPKRGLEPLQASAY